MALALISYAAFAQSDRGMITGTVRDAGNAVIPGARITATHAATNVTAKASTNEAGEFTLPSRWPAIPSGSTQNWRSAA
ncbi:MAG: carboxypeptidase-like regulatory domain-containing protein [Candidatus Solibacter sp.]|nr:carboxypeptidase-like regulatory domain-containing protein [Candidatus Solibacter sp.]